MWRVNFPKTPEGEKIIISYYCQQAEHYVKATKKGSLMTRYFWDGVSESFNWVITDRILDDIDHKENY